MSFACHRSIASWSPVDDHRPSSHRLIRRVINFDLKTQHRSLQQCLRTRYNVFVEEEEEVRLNN